MTLEEELKGVKDSIMRINTVLTLTLLAMCFMALSNKRTTTKLTEKTQEVAQKVDVDFHAKTNTLLWCKTISPR